MASTAVAPSILVSIQPKGSAMWVEPSSARAAATSRSGFGPGATRRNALKMAESPNTRLVLLCSPVSTRLSRPGPVGPGEVGPGDPAEPQRADRPVGHDRLQQRPGQVLIVQRVVDLPARPAPMLACRSRAGSRARWPMNSW